MSALVQLGYPYSPPQASNRRWWFRWPDPGTDYTGTSALQISGTGRAFGVVSGGTGVLNNATVAGSGTALLRTLAAVDKYVLSWDPIARINIDTAATVGPIPQGLSDLACFRFSARMCSSGPTVDNVHDMGMQIVANVGTQLLLLNANTGFGFQLNDQAHAEFIARGPNGLVRTDVTPANFDGTQPHWYDLIIVNRSSSGPSLLIPRIDGNICAVPAASMSWGPGTNLPANAPTGGKIGFIGMMGNACGVAGDRSLEVSDAIMAFGPTLGDVLL